MPNPPKPVEQKRLLGNPGKRALPQGSLELSGLGDSPEPLRPLGVVGEAFWVEAWGKGALWLGRTDAWLVQLTAEMFDEREELRAILAEKVAANDVNAWRDRRQLRDLERSLVTNLSLMAWTPVDRSRYGLAEVKAKSKLADFMEKHG
jgi:hypothetical protein